MPVHQDDHFHFSLVVVCHLLLLVFVCLFCFLLFVVACTCLTFVVVCRLSKILKTAVISFVNNSL